MWTVWIPNEAISIRIVDELLFRFHADFIHDKKLKAQKLCEQLNARLIHMHACMRTHAFCMYKYAHAALAKLSTEQQLISRIDSMIEIKQLFKWLHYKIHVPS